MIKILVGLIFIVSISPVVSQQVGDFSLENTDNELVSLEEIKGSRITIIDFWATWCKPCTKAMPKLNSLYLKYKDQGLSIIGISCDGPRSISKVGAVANSLGIDYHILKDIDCEIMNEYQFQAFPTLIILDHDNEIDWIHEGFASGDGKKIEEAIVARL